MARILCNVAGGGKPLKGNAEPGDVLAGKTFSNKQSNALTGLMPDNGAWSASTAGSNSVTIPAGYHNGSGTVSGSASYSQGVTDADNRVNTSSASYSSGYTNGQSAGVNSGKETMRIKEFAIVWVSFEYHSEIHIYRDGQEVASHNQSAQGNYLRGSLGGGSVNITALRSGTYYVNGSYIYANAGQTIASLSHAEDRGYSLACAACAL